ncbi:hypothetical protein SAMN04487990_102226 [Bizionia paragorgiae]|uniref:Uncharacterized protein n=1 Tax=Bizionia paragorgiae TaxID=283786 RepID=A0A1H3W4N8_BIZPA|nr:hypothetical protein SAMN04487990_102226 [Bizionia paragorgiae]
MKLLSVMAVISLKTTVFNIKKPLDDLLSNGDYFLRL